IIQLRGGNFIMSIVSLPPTIRDRLSSVARRVRWLRALRGLCLLLLVSGGAAAAAMLADHLLDRFFDISLPAWVAGLDLGPWSFLGGVVFRPAVQPLLRRLDHADLAAVVEDRFPELGERLLTSVELTEGEGPDSLALAELLVEETEARSQGLPFDQAVSGRGT